jgi:hypothetical protein
MLRPFWQFLGSLRGEGRGLFLALFGKHNGHSAMAYRVLILCTGNSVRSQMAEGPPPPAWRPRLRRAQRRKQTDGYVSELASEAMRAIGVDISAHRSKSASEFEGRLRHRRDGLRFSRRTLPRLSWGSANRLEHLGSRQRYRIARRKTRRLLPRPPIPESGVPGAFAN